MKSMNRTGMMFLASLLSIFTLQVFALESPEFKAIVMLKTPGNIATSHEIQMERIDGTNSFKYSSGQKTNLDITGEIQKTGYEQNIIISLTALEDVYFNFQQSFNTGYRHADCQFFMPGFWYRHNLRSPQDAPSFHTSDSWLVREDRLSSPLTGILDSTSGNYFTILRNEEIQNAAYTALNYGEVILSGECDLGFTGFENINGEAFLSVGFPYREAPKSYIRKLTLAQPVTAFYKLKKGETKTLRWKIKNGEATDFSNFVAQTWTYTYDHFQPQTVALDFFTDMVKETLSQFFIDSYVETDDLNYFSGIHLHIDDCEDKGGAEVGFIGRVLLNAFFAHEYAEETQNDKLRQIAKKVLDSYLEKGFTYAGFFRESINYHTNEEPDIYSIRRQSEGIYAILKYLDYEKRRGRRHPRWEERLITVLDNFMKLQNADGSFPRKFKENFDLVDATGGSTPSATVPLVMASKYFKNNEYLKSAKRTGDYLEKEIISKSDYFSSTLDANCEDKEASLYASTAMYYLALITKGREQTRYITLAKDAAYFALSWYYLWDVPFAQGQMLGDIGLRSRGWGNVSVENNHIDVFIFEFVDVLNYLAEKTNEPRFSDYANVISSSMLQLLPHPGHMCGIAKTGFYPEVVQHTNWDYGQNGKGFYNDIFAPGWTVASLWEMLTPRAAEKFFQN